MKIPKQLAGKKAEKFEDWVKLLLKNYLTNLVKLTGDGLSFEGFFNVIEESVRLKDELIEELDKVNSFINQPFTPELIELFEGWEWNSSFSKWEYGDKYYFAYDTIEYEFGVRPFCKKTQIPIKTLADFIDACNNSNIELIFKEN